MPANSKNESDNRIHDGPSRVLKRHRTERTVSGTQGISRKTDFSKPLRLLIFRNKGKTDVLCA